MSHQITHAIYSSRALAMNFPQPQSPPANHQPPFGLIIPDHPLRTEFVPVDNSGLRFAIRLQCPGDIRVPLASINDIVFFCLPTVPLPENMGVMVYWQLTEANGPASTGFELLGAITPQKPSAVFRPGWSEHEQLLQVAKSGTPVVLTIGASLEPLETVQNTRQDRTTEQRLFAAQKIAKDLFNYMLSFDAGSGGAGNIVVPHSIFERWFKRFESRFRRDPSFFMRDTED